MRSARGHEAVGSAKTITFVVSIYSLLFMGVVWMGYHLLLQQNQFLSYLLPTLLAFLAWLIAQFLGRGPSIGQYVPLFAFLLLISAVGIFNTLMLTFEGRQIFTEAVESAERQWTILNSGLDGMNDEAVEKRIGRIKGLQSQLEQELRNPMRCGQGDQAYRILQQLREELPSLQPLSRGTRRDCSRVDQVIASYDQLIGQLIRSSDWFKDAEYAQRQEEKARIAKSADINREALAKLRPLIEGSMAANLIKSVKPQLLEIDAQYRESALIFLNRRPDSGIEPKLELLSVKSVGEVSQLPPLLIDRSNKVTTYVYLILAVFVDFLMIYLFVLKRQHENPRRRSARDTGTGRIQTL